MPCQPDPKIVGQVVPAEVEPYMSLLLYRIEAFLSRGAPCSFTHNIQEKTSPKTGGWHRQSAAWGADLPGAYSGENVSAGTASTRLLPPQIACDWDEQVASCCSQSDAICASHESFSRFGTRTPFHPCLLSFILALDACVCATWMDGGRSFAHLNCTLGAAIAFPSHKLWLSLQSL
jgi:hypothetical protein